MTVNEFLEGSIEMNMNLSAHTIYWALIKGLVNGTDNAEKMFEIEIDEKEIAQMTERNILGIEQIKLYVISTKKKDLYAFYFATDGLAARSLHQSLFGDDVSNISNGSRLWGKTMHFAKHDIETSFFDYRKQFIQFPAYIGHAYARQSVCYYLIKGGLSA